MSAILEKAVEVPVIEEESNETDRPQTSPESRRSTETRKQPRYHVVLLDDDDHTYAYVVEMLGKLFHHPKNQAFKMAREVDSTGRVICLTTTMELAELKRDQVLAYGADPLLPNSHGSMRATIEPAES